MLVQKVFGPKFYKDFPTERRPKKGKCKEGIYPSTGGNAYDTTGVDLTLGVGQSVGFMDYRFIELKEQREPSWLKNHFYQIIIDIRR